MILIQDSAKVVSIGVANIFMCVGTAIPQDIRFLSYIHML